MAETVMEELAKLISKKEKAIDDHRAELKEAEAELKEFEAELKKTVSDFVELSRLLRPQQKKQAAQQQQQAALQQQLAALQQQQAALQQQQADQKKHDLQLELHRLTAGQGQGAAAAGTAASLGAGSLGAGGPPLKKVKMDDCSPSDLARSTGWHKYAWNPDSSTSSVEWLNHATFFGFRPAALLPAVIPPQLVVQEFYPILQAAAQAACPPANLSPRLHGPLVKAVLDLLDRSSRLHKNEAELQQAFLDWHNKELKAAGCMSVSSGVSSQAATKPHHDGMVIAGKKFVVSLLECKSDTGGGEPLVQSLRYYQKHYQDGAAWENIARYRADTLPSLVLLLEGPRLSFHAVWTLYQNRIAYAPLTPSYYLANEKGATANLWRLVAVLAAYLQVVQGLMKHYKALEVLEPERYKAMAKLRQAACVDGEQVERPCTLPYSLLDKELGLEDVSFVGPCLLYAAMQRVQEGAGKRAVLIKFVEGRYGQQVHEKWHSVGVAPALYSAKPVGGGSMIMVVMEHLRKEDGWKVLSDVPLEDRGEQLQVAVREALSKAHAVTLSNGNTAAHGDVRGPNVLFRTTEGGGSVTDVRIIDFDWAGANGRDCYPLLLLSPNVKWHRDVRPGGLIHQEHDVHLLNTEFPDAS